MACKINQPGHDRQERRYNQQMIEEVTHREVNLLLDAVMVKLSDLCGHPPDCHLCKADLALGLAAVLAAGQEKLLVNWTNSHYNALDKIAEEETALHEKEAEEQHEKAMQLMFEMKEKEKIKLEVVDGDD
jgi:antirestriction protein